MILLLFAVGAGLSLAIIWLCVVGAIAAVEAMRNCFDDRKETT